MDPAVNPDEQGLQTLGMQLQGGALSRLSPNATRDEQTTVLNNIVDHLNDMLKSQIYSDDNTKRYIQGYSPGRWPGGDFGTAISAEGDDVTKVPFESLIFAWDFSTNKQYIRGGVQTYTDSNGKKVMDIGTLSDNRTGIDWFNPENQINFMRAGVMPDDTGGFVVAKPGFNVKDLY